jgi:hypothetical protein
MATFTYDPARLHPPEPNTSLTAAPQATTREVPTGPFTQQTYDTDPALVSMALGSSGEAHRIVYVHIANRTKRGMGHMRALLTQVMLDLDADRMPCTCIIRNYEPDVDPQRLTGLFEDFGFVVESTDPEISLRRDAR